MKKEREKVIIKFGSSSVADGQGMRTEQVDGFSEQVTRLSEKYDVIVVTSGAIATGRAKWNAQNREPTDKSPSQRSFATMGSGSTYMTWERCFEARGKAVGQIQATNHEIDDIEEGGALREVLLDNISCRVVSVLNGNDATSKEGAADLDMSIDNDYLAIHAGFLVGAQHVLLMTGKQGLLDENKTLVPEVTQDNVRWALGLGGDAGLLGRGGPQLKTAYAYLASLWSMEAHIARAGTDLQAVIDREPGSGTHFAAQ